MAGDIVITAPPRSQKLSYFAQSGDKAYVIIRVNGKAPSSIRHSIIQLKVTR